jgi:hypothetical protein
MHLRRWIAVLGTGMTLAITSPATAAAPPQASCPGQELAVLGPALGSQLGAAISFEARNPELEGRKSFGEEVRSLALADRAACPEEG